MSQPHTCSVNRKLSIQYMFNLAFLSYLCTTIASECEFVFMAHTDIKTRLLSYPVEITQYKLSMFMPTQPDDYLVIVAKSTQGER